jgi:hypothetical protein
MCKCGKKKTSTQIAYAVYQSAAVADDVFATITPAPMLLKTTHGNYRAKSGASIPPSAIASDLFNMHAPIWVS